RLEITIAKIRRVRIAPGDRCGSALRVRGVVSEKLCRGNGEHPRAELAFWITAHRLRPSCIEPLARMQDGIGAQRPGSDSDSIRGARKRIDQAHSQMTGKH